MTAEPPGEEFPAFPASPAVYTWEDEMGAWYFSLAGTLGVVKKEGTSYRVVLNQPWGVQSFFRSSGAPLVGMVSQGRIQIWDFREGRMILDLDPSGFLGTPALSPEGTILAFVQNEAAAGESMPFVTVMDVTASRVFRRFPGVEGPLVFHSPFQLQGRLPQGSKVIMNLLDGTQRSEPYLPPPVSPLPIPAAGRPELPESPKVENLRFTGKDRDLTFTLAGKSFRFTPYYYPLVEPLSGFPLPAFPRVYPLPADVRPPPGSLRTGNPEGTLFVHTGFNNRLHLFFNRPEAPESLKAVYEQPFLEGGLTAMDLSPDGQWLALGDDLGHILVWNIPSGRAAGLWNLSPLLEDSSVTGLGPGPWDSLADWDPYLLPFPSGIHPPSPDNWSGEGPAASGQLRRRIPWTDRLPDVLKGEYFYGNKEGALKGFTLIRTPGSSKNSAYPMVGMGEHTFVLQPGNTESRLIRLDARGLPDASGVLPGKFTQVTLRPGNRLLVLGTEQASGQAGKVKLLVWELDADMNIASAYRSYFLTSGDPQVQSGTETPWVGFHWPEKNRSTWTSTLKFFNFEAKTSWEIQMPLGLDMSGHYSGSKPEFLGRDGRGKFLLPLSGTLRLRPREQGSAVLGFYPEQKTLTAQFLPLPPGMEVTALQPSAPDQLAGLTPSGPLIWPRNGLPAVYSLPNLTQNRALWWDWTRQTGTQESSGTFLLPLDQKKSPGWGLADGTRMIFSQIPLDSGVQSFLSQDFLNRVLIHTQSRDYQFRSEDEEAFLWFSGGIDLAVPSGDSIIKPQNLVPLKALASTVEELSLPYRQDTTELLWNWESYSPELRKERPNFMPIFGR